MANFDIISSSGGGGTGYDLVQEAGSNKPVETTLNFVGGNWTITDNPGNSSTDIAVTTSALAPWTVVAINTAMVVDNNYFSGAVTPIDLTLPASCGVGATFQACAQLGKWVIKQRAGQSIQLEANTTTVGTGGSITCNDTTGDWIEIVCVVANTGFMANMKSGNATVV